MLKIIIGANSGIQISEKIIEALKNRGIEFTLELDLLNNSYIEFELDNKTIILDSEEDLIKILDYFENKKGDDFGNASFNISDNDLFYSVIA